MASEAVNVKSMAAQAFEARGLAGFSDHAACLIVISIALTSGMPPTVCHSSPRVMLEYAQAQVALRQSTLQHAGWSSYNDAY